MIRANLNGIKKVKAKLRANSTYARIANVAVKEIKKTIVSGNSPVKGKGRYQRYSPSYLDAIDAGYGAVGRYGKKPLPVNLVLSGKMINSLAFSISGGRILIEFTDKKAEYHDLLGAGKSKVLRRMLPTRNGEKLSARITKEIKAEITIVKNLLIRLGNTA